ncbi:DUF4349 domain-containing protein [Winogradskyella sp. 3972H.M.0a.05]|uniref:DUF4349 domain-containing protein n=1 Tax=Winogradskyella sp. 3972H.M.0a.05 TaxID=2950277 RepID=UPI00339A820B
MKANLSMLVKVSLIILLLNACNNSESYKESVLLTDNEIKDDFEAASYEYDKSGSEVLDLEVLNKPKSPDLKIIKTARVRYKVKDIKRATSKLKALAASRNAYISDLRFQNNLYRKENKFTIKIPQQYFDVMIDSMSHVAEFIEFENITSDDVTEEYVDIQTRLKTKLEVRQRYEEILRKRAKTVEDILATEEKLRVIQEEIEASQGRLKYLTSKVAFSTIHIELYETVEYKEEPEVYSKTFLDKTKEGFSFGWEIIERFVLFLIYIWPLLIVTAVLVFIIRKKVMKKK